MSASEAMSSADTAWLHMDRPNNLMVITGALWFDEPVDWDQFREVISSRLVEPFPRFRQRVAESRLPMRGPHWEDDPDFDLDRHLHHTTLPAPGDRAALEDFVSDLIAQPLDRSRALWDWYLVDGYGSGSAIVARMHHCIADGIALARVLLSLTDSTPEAGIEPYVPAETEHHGGLTGAVGDVLRPARQVASLTRTLAGAAAHEAFEIARDPSELVDLAAAVSTDAKALAKTLLPGADTRTVLRGELGVPERVAWSDPIPLADVKTAGHTHGATVNDILVAAVAGALRTYLAGRDSLVEELHAFVPFNLRVVVADQGDVLRDAERVGHGKGLHDAQRQEVVGTEDALGNFVCAAAHQLVAHRAAREDRLPVRLHDFQRRLRNVCDGAPRPLEAVRELSDRRRPCHEGEPTAADVQQVPGSEVAAFDVVDRDGTVAGVVREPVHQDGGHAAIPELVDAFRDVADGRDQEALDALLLEKVDVA
jgi:hypothetical protein